QAGLFATHATALREGMFGITPYMEYESYTNWIPAFVVSAEAGASHPPYQAGCTTSACCADTTAQSDPRAGQFTDTAFDSRFCAFQIHRLLVSNNSLVLAAAQAYPDWDVLLVSVNDPVYGGSGGQVGVLSQHPAAQEVTIHEFGHTFTGLADEYDSPYPGYPACTDLGGGSPCEANVTNQTLAGSVKWRDLFTPGIQIPTPPGTPGTGLFEGARYQTLGMYRPADQCEMRQLGVEFCSVCRQEYVKHLYRGGWGTPAGGIDPIEPGSESPATDQPVVVAAGSTQVFEATLLQPSIGAHAVQWWLDGVPVAGADAASFPFSQASTSPSTRTLELRVSDPTALVLASMADGLLESSRSWTIEIVEGDGIFADGFEP
ncbi:MAG TPA: M64 family metallopeptidase, partial [Dokdonella sp.]